jgi:hypothetical protein
MRIVFALLLMACPPAQQKAAVDAAPSICTAVGQSCEFAPGKLGSCVHRDDCTTEPCMVCQSQH